MAQRGALAHPAPGLLRSRCHRAHQPPAARATSRARCRLAEAARRREPARFRSAPLRMSGRSLWTTRSSDPPSNGTAGASRCRRARGPGRRPARREAAGVSRRDLPTSLPAGSAALTRRPSRSRGRRIVPLVGVRPATGRTGCRRSRVLLPSHRGVLAGRRPRSSPASTGGTSTARARRPARWPAHRPHRSSRPPSTRSHALKGPGLPGSGFHRAHEVLTLVTASCAQASSRRARQVEPEPHESSDDRNFVRLAPCRTGLPPGVGTRPPCGPTGSQPGPRRSGQRRRRGRSGSGIELSRSPCGFFARPEAGAGSPGAERLGVPRRTASAAPGAAPTGTGSVEAMAAGRAAAMRQCRPQVSVAAPLVTVPRRARGPGTPGRPGAGATRWRCIAAQDAIGGRPTTVPPPEGPRGIGAVGPAPPRLPARQDIAGRAGTRPASTAAPAAHHHSRHPATRA